MLAALIVSRRSEPARGSAFEFDAFYVAVEREVEIESGLFSVGDYVEAGRNLVVNGGDNGILLHLTDVVYSKLIEVLGGEF